VTVRSRDLWLLAIWLLLASAASAQAAKLIVVDPQSGEVTVTEEGTLEAPPETEEPPAVCPEDREKIARLKEIARRQQAVIRRQQKRIKEMREELWHQEQIILGLEQLRRQGR